jgi:2-oxoglutarate/2-oxoacid ferredoxin oxidoreductase subunit alpha
VWTVEIIPAEIQPPPRVPEGASGNRIRVGTGTVTNWGDETNLVVAFNEQVLLARHRAVALAKDAIILLEDSWAERPDEDVQRAWRAALDELASRDNRIIPVPMDAQCLTLVDNSRKGKNMFALGILAWIHDGDRAVRHERGRDRARARAEPAGRRARPHRLTGDVPT